MRNKMLLALIVVLVIVAGSLFATDSRMAALGSPFGYIRDSSDLSSFPGAINRYNRQLVGELYSSGSSSDWTIGANLPIMNYIWGVYLNTNTGVNVDSYINTAPPNYYSPGDLDISKKIQFYVGLMDHFGAGFAMAIDSKKTDMADNPNKFYEAAATYLEFSGGMSTDKIDAGGKLSIAGASVENDINENTEKYSEMTLQGSGRYYLMDNNSLAVMAVGNLAINTIKEESKVVAASTITGTIKDSHMMVDVGIGANYKMGEKNTVIFGVKPLRFATYNNEESGSNQSGHDGTKYGYTYVPEYNLAVESQIASWLVGRVGARQNYLFYSRTYDPTGDWDDVSGQEEDTDSYYTSSFNMNLGLGFKFGKFCIDTVLSKSLLHDGPYFIGGTGSGLATQVSVSYRN